MTEPGNISQPAGMHRQQQDYSARRVSHSKEKVDHLRRGPRQDNQADQPIDPELTKRDMSSQPGYAEAIKAWTRFRFVRAGWLTAQEAIEYID